jgi:acetolactate synthase regulatory subunit
LVGLGLEVRLKRILRIFKRRGNLVVSFNFVITARSESTWLRVRKLLFSMMEGSSFLCI